MKYTYSCKKVSLNDSIKEYAEKKISKLERYFREEDPSAAVTFSVEKNHLCTVEITIRDGGTLFRAQTQAPDGDMRSAVDAAVGYIERQILKNKTRLAKRLRSENFPTAMPDDDFEVAEEKELWYRCCCRWRGGWDGPVPGRSPGSRIWGSKGFASSCTSP